LRLCYKQTVRSKEAEIEMEYIVGQNRKNVSDRWKQNIDVFYTNIWQTVQKLHFNSFLGQVRQVIIYHLPNKALSDV
jgi:hypothetical protein